MIQQNGQIAQFKSTGRPENSAHHCHQVFRLNFVEQERKDWGKIKTMSSHVVIFPLTNFIASVVSPKRVAFI